MSAIATEQRMDHLAKANEVRLDRARLKRRIAGGQVTVASVLTSPPPEALTWSVGGLVMAQHRWGCSRMRALLRRTGTVDAPPIPELKQIGALTEGQTGRILAGLAAR